jgi:hypothetical protein
VGFGLFRLLSRIAAIWIATLILLPFTAPFSTYDLHDHSSNSPYDTLAKDQAKADDVAVFASSQIRGLGLGAFTSLEPSRESRRISFRRLLRPVLRL